MRAFAPVILCAALLAPFGACKRTLPSSEVTTPRRPEKRVRLATAAGRFYPGDAVELKQTIEALLAAESPVVAGDVPILLVPHAGLPFSGRVAALAFKQVKAPFERVVVVAANHNDQADFRGVSIDRSTHFAYPGGEVPVAAAAAALIGKPRFVDVPAAHVDHMIEIELPFLRAIAGERPFDLVPMVVGRISREEARTLAGELARLNDRDRPGRTLFVFSVDLSHFHPQAEAESRDRACLDALARMNEDDLVRCDTDGTQVLAILAELAAMLETAPRLLRYTNSGEVTKDPSSVVGYGAMAFEAGFAVNAGEQQQLLALARRAIEARVREGREYQAAAEVTWRFPRLRLARGAFVTLKKRGELRGCIGNLTADEPLADDVVRNAVSAAVRDPRFPPVRPEEVDGLSLSISVLDTPRPLGAMAPDALVRWLGEHKPDVILDYQARRATFLPEVWEELSLPAVFLAQLCRKQGSPAECWRDGQASFSTYGAQHFAEQAGSAAGRGAAR